MIIRDSLFVHSVLTADIKLKFTDTQRFERINDFPKITFINSSKISLESKLGSLKIKPVKRIVPTIESFR